MHQVPGLHLGATLQTRRQVCKCKNGTYYAYLGTAVRAPAACTMTTAAQCWSPPCSHFSGGASVGIASASAAMPGSPTGTTSASLLAKKSKRQAQMSEVESSRRLTHDGLEPRRATNTFDKATLAFEKQKSARSRNVTYSKCTIVPQPNW
jgi:hypothetical protein